MLFRSQAIPPQNTHEHVEQNGGRLPVVLPRGKPVFSLPSQLSWLCLRCSRTAIICTVLFGFALALFVALKAMYCKGEGGEGYGLVRDLEAVHAEAESKPENARPGMVSTMLLLVVATSLILHSISWSVADPFVDFSVETLEELGVGESFNVQGAVGQLQS